MITTHTVPIYHGMYVRDDVDSICFVVLLFDSYSRNIILCVRCFSPNVCYLLTLRFTLQYLWNTIHTHTQTHFHQCIQQNIYTARWLQMTKSHTDYNSSIHIFEVHTPYKQSIIIPYIKTTFIHTHTIPVFSHCLCSGAFYYTEKAFFFYLFDF